MSIKKEINTFYDSKKLSFAQLAELQDIQKQGSLFSMNSLRPAFVGALATCVIIFSYLNLTRNPLDRIAKEVAYNHNKNMPSEVLTADYAVMNEALDRLDFSIKDSDRVAQNYTVQGARYCSVLGKIAAQIKLIDKKTGKVSTLYQYRPEKPEIFDSKRLVSRKIDQTNISMWKKDKIVFILAH